MRRTIAVLSLALVIGNAYAFGQSRSAAPSPELRIDQVTVSDPIISIRGKNFGTNPIVLMPGGSPNPLQIQPPTTSELIVAFLPPNVAPGTYALIISRGPSTNDTSMMDFTIGAQGQTGAPGKDGKDGAPGRDGIDGTNGKDGVNGINGSNGLQCWDLNGNRVNDPAEDRNADGMFTTLDCQGPIGPAGPASVEAWGAKRTGFVAFSGVTAWATIPGLTVTINLQRSALVQLLANGSQRTTGGISHMAYRYVVDGIAAGDANHGQMIQTADNTDDGWVPWTLAHFVNLNAGPHTIAVQTRNSFLMSGTPQGAICGVSGSIFGYTDCTLNVLAVYPLN
jgi:hypothetical protein